MGDEDLYTGDIRNYYNIPHIIRLTNDKTMVNNSFPDGKTQRKKVDVELLEEERVDYEYI